MKRVTLTCALVACSITPAFAASSAAGSAASCVGSMASSHTTSPGNDTEKKMVLQARDDAASFVASDGRVRGAQLEAALRYLREQHLNARVASDMQLAQAIAAY